MTALETLIVGTETALSEARSQYNRASARRDMTGMFTWGQETSRLVRELENLGEYEDMGRSAFAIGLER